MRVRGHLVNQRSYTWIEPTSTVHTPRKPPRRPLAPWAGIVYFIILAVVSLTLVTWKVKGRAPVAAFESVVLSVTLPLQHSINWVMRGVGGVWDRYIDLVHVRQQNIRQQEEIKWLREENNRFLEAYLQYQRLQRLLNFKEWLPPEMVATEVVGRDSNNWTEIIYINKGTRDGVSKGLAVVTHEGLVGQVIHAAPMNSKVMLITDFRSGVDALVQRTRTSGVVAGRGRNVAELKFLPVGADVQPGDRLISSGMGGVFPKGLIIGEVKGIHLNGSQFQDVEVKPSIDFSRLEEVLVLVKR
ncbi:MAG: rod shape-determining protein MreC [Nitrospinae bacterium]|nr:rod shape-determining protein MreC [Nitrospinota bacterium]